MVICWIVSVSNFDSLPNVCHVSHVSHVSHVCQVFKALLQGSNTDQRSTLLVVIMSNDSLRCH